MLRLFVALAAGLVALLILTPILLLILPFALMAVAVRRLRRELDPGCIHWKQALRDDPTLGWRPRPDLNAFCRFAMGDFHVQTGPDGWFGPEPSASSDLIVFGDSYAFGYGVDHANAFFTRSAPKLKIKSLGAPGYSMVHSLILMRQMRQELRGKPVVWFVYVGNDLYDNLLPFSSGRPAPFLRCQKGEWSVEAGHLSRSRAPFKANGRLRLRQKWLGTFGSNELADRIYSGCEFLIQEAAHCCSEAGARLIVLTIPWTVQMDRRQWDAQIQRLDLPQGLDPQRPDREIRRICSSRRVELVEARNILELKDHIPGEWHWNERGHARISSLLQDCHRDHQAALKARQGARLTVAAARMG